MGKRSYVPFIRDHEAVRGFLVVVQRHSTGIFGAVSWKKVLELFIEYRKNLPSKHGASVAVSGLGHNGLIHRFSSYGEDLVRLTEKGMKYLES